MKKMLKSITLTAAMVAVCALSASAQNITVNGTVYAPVSNTAGPVTPNLMPATTTADIASIIDVPTTWGGVTEIYKAFETATNWTVAVGAGRGLSGKNNNVAFADLAYNIVTTSNGFGAGLIIGDEIMFGHGKPQVSTVAGGINLNGEITPLAFLGLTSFTGDFWVADLMATPQNGNAIGNLVVTGIAFHVFTVKNFSIKIAPAYENRQGQGKYDGGFGLLSLTATRLF